MAKTRVHLLAKELAMETKDLIAQLDKLGVRGRKAQSSLEDDEEARVRPALAGSYEELFHATAQPSFWIDLRERNSANDLLQRERLQRAIGVIYRPETERLSHYFEVRLPAQFDAIIHIDETRGLEPLERTSQWDRGELPETYPTTL